MFLPVCSEGILHFLNDISPYDLFQQLFTALVSLHALFIEHFISLLVILKERKRNVKDQLSVLDFNNFIGVDSVK